MTPPIPPNDENAGDTVNIELFSYLKPVLEVTDFSYRVDPLLDGATGELVGATILLWHPVWPAAVRLKVDRLKLVELGSGFLALVDSHDNRADESPPTR